MNPSFNMSPDEALRGLEEKNRQLTMKNDEYTPLTERYAAAKRDYRIARAKKMMEIKMAGTSITLIPNLANGDGIVADLRYKMDVAEGVVKANVESMKDIRSAIDSYRSILTWLREEKTRG